MNVLETLEAMEAAAQGNARLEALKKGDSPELRRLLGLALSPDCTFGVKKLPPPEETDNDKFFDGGWYEALLVILSRLEERTLTGHEARDTISGFLGVCTREQQKWSERIFRQDLRLGINAKSVNRALGEVVIPLFEVPLATDYAKIKARDLEGTWALEPKLDGGRCVAVLPGTGGRVKLLSRTGKGWNNFESIRIVLQDWNDHRENSLADEVIYLDGEIISYVEGRIDFQAIQKVMHAHDGREIGDLVFAVFDAAFKAEWLSPRVSYGERLQLAADTVADIGCPAKVSIIPALTTQLSGDQVAVDFLKHACTRFVEEGFEGAMARRLDLPVENKRGKRLLKVKTFLDEEAVIVGAVEGTGKLVGKLGALICKTKAGVTFEIGSGFDDKQREEIWFDWQQTQNPPRHSYRKMPRIVTFKYQELTDDGVPRFPIFRGFRSEDDI